MNAYGFVLTGPNFPQVDTSLSTPVNPVVPTGPIKSEEELHLEKYGLTWSLLESSGGSIAADKMKDILDCIDDDYFSLNLRYSTASALLTWFTAANESLRDSVFDRFYYKTLQTIRFDLINTAAPITNSIPNDVTSSLYAVSITATKQHNRFRPAHFLSLWLQKQALANHAFRLKILSEVLSVLNSVVEKKVIMSDSPLDNETGDTDSTVKAEIVKVLLRILPHEAQDFLDALPDEEEYKVIPLLVALDDLAGDRCDSVGDAAADLVRILAETKDENVLLSHEQALMTMMRRGRGQIFDIMKNYSHFFESPSQELAASLGKMLPKTGFASAAKWLEELADRDPASLLPHIDALVDRLGDELADNQAKIMRVMLSVGLVEPQGMLQSVRHTAEKCLLILQKEVHSSCFSLLIPFVKVLAAVGTWSEAAAMQCLGVAALVTRTLVNNNSNNNSNLPETPGKSSRLSSPAPSSPLPPFNNNVSAMNSVKNNNNTNNNNNNNNNNFNSNFNVSGKNNVPISSKASNKPSQEPLQFAPLSPDLVALSKRNTKSLTGAVNDETATTTSSTTSSSAFRLDTGDLQLDTERKEVLLALLELFNVLKDKCAYCNLLSNATIATLATLRELDATLVDNILNWNNGKRARRGDRRLLLLHAGELYVSRHPEVKRLLQTHAKNRDTSDSSSVSWLRYFSPNKTQKDTPSHHSSVSVAPSPVSMTLTLQHTSTSPAPPSSTSPAPPSSTSVSTSRRAQQPFQVPLQPVKEDDKDFSPSYPQSTRNFNNNNETLAPKRLFGDCDTASVASTETPVLSFAEFVARQKQQQNVSETHDTVRDTANTTSSSAETFQNYRRPSGDVVVSSSSKPLVSPVSSVSSVSSANNNNNNTTSNTTSRTLASAKSTPPASPSKKSETRDTNKGFLRWIASPFRNNNNNNNNGRSPSKRPPSTIAEENETDDAHIVETHTETRVAPLPLATLPTPSVREAPVQFGGIRGSFSPATQQDTGSGVPSALQEFNLQSNMQTNNSSNLNNNVPSMLFTPIAYSTRQ